MEEPNFNCAAVEPFVKLEENGSAAVLNYNLPQKSSFASYGDVVLKVP